MKLTKDEAVLFYSAINDIEKRSTFKKLETKGIFNDFCVKCLKKRLLEYMRYEMQYGLRLTIAKAYKVNQD